MIICRTPFRLSFFGGGTDYPKWYLEHSGKVLATTINKYCYVSCRYLPPFFNHKHRIIYSKIENVKTTEEIEHPAVRAVLETLNIRNGLEIHYDADLPSHSGIGACSTFTVSLLHALHAFYRSTISKQELARLAIYIEQDVIKECVGCQDQIAASYGGMNIIDFHKNDEFVVEPLILSKEREQEFEDHLMFFFTGFSRFAPLVAQSKVDQMSVRVNELKTIQSLVNEAIDILRNSNADIRDLGKLLHESWLLKRTLSHEVSTPEIDEIYTEAKRAGALGGKIIGAGGGGFLLLFVEPEKQQKVRERLSHLVKINIRFEKSGSHIIFYNPDTGLEDEVNESLAFEPKSQQNWFVTT